MNLLVKTKFGSHLYGTDTPTSDIDIKGVYLPEARDILLQRVKDNVNTQTKVDKHARNSADDVDMEVFSLQEYLRLLMEGQTVAIDMLFTPSDFYLMESSPEWRQVLEHKEKFVHSGSSAFAGYCKTQSNKYCLKGTRLSTVRGALELVGKLYDSGSGYQRLSDFEKQMAEFNEGKEFANFVDCKGPKEGTFTKHWEVCNRKIPFHATVKYTHERLSDVVNEYGDRAKKAEENAGKDWKALSHAVRVCQEAIELMNTGKVTFPRPEADLLLQIKKGEMEYDLVAALIEKGLAELEVATANSTMRKKPDSEFADDLVVQAYGDVVRKQLLR